MFFDKALTKVFGTANERAIKKLMPAIAITSQVIGLESHIRMSNAMRKLLWFAPPSVRSLPARQVARGNELFAETKGARAEAAGIFVEVLDGRVCALATGWTAARSN